MSKTKRTPLEKIQTLETMKVAKLFFNTYLTPSIVTMIMHKKAWANCREKTQQGFVMPYIRDCLKEWKEEGFIETCKLPFRVEKKTGKSYWLENYGYRLNLNPLYRFCKEKNNIEFTKEEKEIINKRIGLEVMRKRIFIEYPNDDIITASLKFYVKQYAIPPLEILDDKNMKMFDLAKKLSKEESQRAEAEMKIIKKKRQKDKSSKKEKPLQSIEFERLLQENTMKNLLESFVNKKTQKLKLPLKELQKFAELTRVMLYITSYNKNPKLISSINRKFKMALGILL